MWKISNSTVKRLIVCCLLYCCYTSYSFLNSQTELPNPSSIINESKSVDKDKSIDSIKNAFWERVDWNAKIQIAFKNSFVDKSNSYSMLRDVGSLTGEPPPNKHQQLDVLLGTHGTINHLVNVIELSKRWRGPIAVAIFLFNEDLTLVTIYIRSLQRCYPSVQENVTFHLSFPRVDGVYINSTLVNEMSTLTCDELFDAINEKIEEGNFDKNFNHNATYPSNVLRNFAIGYSDTEYVFSIDIDLLPNSDMHEDFLNFLNTNKYIRQDDKIIYIIPPLEMKVQKPIPTDKKELLQEHQASNVQPFYANLCIVCHSNTRIDEWFKYSDDEKFGISYYVEYDNRWDPFLISKRTAPFFDERFIQYGFERVSLACELYIAGYKFAVPNNAFLVHDTEKMKQHMSPSKVRQRRESFFLYRGFIQELKVKYPDSVRTCK